MESTWAILIRRPLDPAKTSRLVSHIRKRFPHIGLVPLSYPSHSASPSKVLTPRQREVLREMTAGNGTKEIAQILGISPKTVESHRKELMDRLAIYHLPGLVRYALRSGIVPGAWLLESR